MPTRLVTKEFHLHMVAATLLLYLVPSAVSEDKAAASNEYEIPGSVKAEHFLPKSVFAGKKRFVEKTAKNNGLQNAYRIKAGTKTYEVTGSSAAVELFYELRAISQLRQISTAKAFKSGARLATKAFRW
jgi:hypothetical protein